MDQKVEQRIFRKFSQWYYINAKKEMPIPDAPELVALLQAVGFKLCNMGIGGKESGRAPAALKVTIECGSSGVLAELRAPAESPCRCTVFSSKEEAVQEEAQEQASFWTITTSQVTLVAAYVFAVYLLISNQMGFSHLLGCFLENVIGKKRKCFEIDNEEYFIPNLFLISAIFLVLIIFPGLLFLGIIKEKVNSAGEIGSSLLPEICGQRAVVIKEVFQLLQDELFALPHAAKQKMGSQKRLSLPPVPKFDATAMQRSADSLDKTDAHSEWNGSIPTTADGQDADGRAAGLMRRASFGCGADLKNVAPLPPKLPAKNKQLSSNSSLVDDAFVTAEAAVDPEVVNGERIRKLLISALDLLGAKGSAAGKPLLERKTTFVMPRDDENLKDPARKRTKFASTPGNVARGASSSLRVPTPKPVASTKLFPPSPATGLQKMSLRSTNSSPMASMIPGTTASRSRTSETVRRRSFVAGTTASSSMRLYRTSVLSPKAELNESNTSITSQTSSKSKLSKRASLPLKPTYAKENRLA